MKLFLKLSLIFLGFCNIQAAIYGPDDRYEINNYPDQLFQDYAKSVAGLVQTKRLKPDLLSTDKYYYEKITLEDFYPQLCPGTRFAKQPVLTSCTGFLIAEDLLLTAGHCIKDESKCSDDYRWVFNFNAESETIASHDIYKCERILTSKVIKKRQMVASPITADSLKIDYAIVKVKPIVSTSRKKGLPIRKSGRALPYTPVLTIGHPMGLPLKVSDNAYVSLALNQREGNPLDSYFFGFNRMLTNLDTFIHNSGGPVINVDTQKVEGIFISGTQDTEDYYDKYGKCQKIKKIANENHRFQEEVLLLSSIPELKNLKKLRKKKTEITMDESMIKDLEEVLQFSSKSN